MFENIWLHIGPHKSGSSAIQLTCDQNREVLRDLGYFYPSGHWHGQLGSCFAKVKIGYVYNRHAGRFDASSIQQEDDRYIAQLASAFELSDEKNLILSYEGFIDLAPTEIVELRNFLNRFGKNILVVAYCRHPLSFAPSEISQRCRMGEPTGRLDNAIPPIPKFETYISKFEDVVGRNNILLSDFAPEALVRGDVRLDFLTTIGISESDLDKFRLTPDRTNERLSAEAIYIGEALRELIPRERSDNNFFLRYDRVLTSIKGTRFTLSATERARLLEASKPHLQYLQEHFGLTLHPPLDEEAISEYSVVNPDAVRSIATHLKDIDPVTQSYQWLLGREPESADVVSRHLTAIGGNWRHHRENILRSPEFARIVRPYLDGNGSTRHLLDSSIRKDSNVVPVDEVTICMIVFNESEFLPRCLSALKAYFEKFIIADMGSSDNTIEILQDILGPRVELLAYDREKLIDKGYAAARNFCAAHAKTPWVLAVDADEILLPLASSKQIVLNHSEPNVKIARIERHNLPPQSGAFPEGVRPIERPNRLYRAGEVQWSGYIHEELLDLQSSAIVHTDAALIFEHLSMLRRPSRITDKRAMYRWMLLRAYNNPHLRGATNNWWYEKFVPEHLDVITADAATFRSATAAVVDQSSSSAEDDLPVIKFGVIETSKMNTGETIEPTATGKRWRSLILQSLWAGRDPFEGLSPKLYAADRQGWNSEHSYLAATVREIKPNVIVEIGVWKGGSTITLAQAAKDLDLDATVIAVDTWLGAWDHWINETWKLELCFENAYPHLYYKFASNVLESGVQEFVVPLPIDSANAFQILKRKAISAQIIHLDGAHDYDTVSRDLSMWWSIISPGGVLIADDYFQDGRTWPDVQRAVDEFTKLTPHTKFESHNGKCRIFKG